MDAERVYIRDTATSVDGHLVEPIRYLERRERQSLRAACYWVASIVGSTTVSQMDQAREDRDHLPSYFEDLEDEQFARLVDLAVRAITYGEVDPVNPLKRQIQTTLEEKCNLFGVNREIVGSLLYRGLKGTKERQVLPTSDTITGAYHGLLVHMFNQPENVSLRFADQFHNPSRFVACYALAGQMNYIPTVRAPEQVA